MKVNTVILIAEDDAGHFELVKRNLWLTCVDNDIIHFRDGQEVLDYLMNDMNISSQENFSCVLLLDIKMPKVDGEEVLRIIKQDSRLKKIPVIMLTTTNDPTEIQRCYELGCSFYMVKPVNYHKFMSAVEQLGIFLSMEDLRVPLLDGH